MRKYVLTDRQGVTATGQTLSPGKHIQTTRDKSSLLQQLSDCAADTPLLAALISPIPVAEARLFNINCWNVTIDPKNGQSYTVIKEVERMPAVTHAQRLHFAILVTNETCKDQNFRRWADHWLDETDRTLESATQVLADVDKELRAAADLQAIGAWEESGADAEQAQRLDLGEQRARHVLRAVCLLEDPGRATSAAMELAQALTQLEALPAATLEAFSTAVMVEPVLRQAHG